MTQTLELRRTIDTEGNVSLDIPEDATDEQREILTQFMQPRTPLWEIAGVPPTGNSPRPDDASVITLLGVVCIDDYKKAENGQYLVDEETGELQPCTTSLFLTVDGRVFNSPSPAVARWVRDNLLKLWGGPLYGKLRKPKRVRVEKTKTRNGRPTFQFWYMPDQGV